jgi:hypothetical protein
VRGQRRRWRILYVRPPVLCTRSPATERDAVPAVRYAHHNTGGRCMLQRDGKQQVPSCSEYFWGPDMRSSRIESRDYGLSVATLAAAVFSMTMTLQPSLRYLRSSFSMSWVPAHSPWMPVAGSTLQCSAVQCSTFSLHHGHVFVLCNCAQLGSAPQDY